MAGAVSMRPGAASSSPPRTKTNICNHKPAIEGSGRLRPDTIDIEALRRDRDQLWAEAAEGEAEGKPLILPKELWGEASVAQDERRQHDPWGRHFSRRDRPALCQTQQGN